MSPKGTESPMVGSLVADVSMVMVRGGGLCSRQTSNGRKRSDIRCRVPVSSLSYEDLM
jgi:hypothetical protein